MTRSVDAYIASLDEQRSALVAYLRSVIRSVSADITERISYGVPFFYSISHLCYINPRKTDVQLGFTRGHELHDSHGVLETGTRKVVRVITYRLDEDVDESVLRDMIHEAVRVDRTKAQRPR